MSWILPLYLNYGYDFNSKNTYNSNMEMIFTNP